MTGPARHRPSRALVLGGGGVTGIAWEVGVLAGLQDTGVDLADADAVIGTSAGSFVGAALASGYDMTRLFDAQAAPGPVAVSATVSEELLAAWYDAFAAGGADPEKVGAAFGRIGKAHPEPVPAALRRRVVEARLVTTDWPSSLWVTAIDADTGQLHTFDRTSGVPLVDAVAASGAVPGLWPVQRIHERTWVDGGMVSAANARLAEAFERVVVVAPLADGYGAVPGAAQDVASMSRRARVALVAPDRQSTEAIGPNIYDAARRQLAAEAGRRQGAETAGAVATVW